MESNDTTKTSTTSGSLTPTELQNELMIEDISDTSSTSSICDLTNSQQQIITSLNNSNNNNNNVNLNDIEGDSSTTTTTTTATATTEATNDQQNNNKVLPTTSIIADNGNNTTTTTTTTATPQTTDSISNNNNNTGLMLPPTTIPIHSSYNNSNNSNSNSSNTASTTMAAALANSMVTTSNNNTTITFQRPLGKTIMSGGSAGNIIVNGGNSILNSKSNSSGSLKDGSERKPEPSKLEKMITSIKADNKIFLEKILKTKPVIPLTIVLAKKDTLLHIACKYMKMVSVIYLLEKTKSDLVNCQNEKLKTPFFICCENGFFKAATLLLDQGASPLLSNNQRWTPLHKLCSLELKKVLYKPNIDALIGYSQENHLDLVQKIFLSLEKIKSNSSSSVVNSIIASRTKQNQTPLHLSLISGNIALSKYLLTHSTVESLKIKDNNGNTVLHILAFKYDARLFLIAESILKLLAESQIGEELQDYIDDINNSMASALQISMKNNHTQLSKLIVKFRAQAESKILESFFTQLSLFDASEISKYPIESIVYNDEFRQTNSFGRLITRIIIIIKQHYTINMSHQNANILLKRAKDTLSRLFGWLDSNINDHNYSRQYKQLIFTQIYDIIIHLYQETNKSKDLLFQQRVNMFKNVEYNELDISESSWEKNVDLLPKALEIINSLQNKKTPSEKIDALNDATMQISRTDANDLTPMFMYLLIKSQIEAVQSQFQFMNDFKETPEQEQYLVLLQGSLDYLDTLNVTLRNSQNQIMSLSGIVERTIDNLLSLLDEFQNQPNYNGADQVVDDIDEGIQIADEIILLIMMLSKLSNRVNNDPIFLQLKWCPAVMNAYHFKAVIERLGLRLESDESILIKTNNSNLIKNNNSPISNKIVYSPPSSTLLSTSSSSTITNNKPLMKQPSFKELISSSLPLPNGNNSSNNSNNSNSNITQSCNINSNSNNNSNNSPTTTTTITTLISPSTSPTKNSIGINNNINLENNNGNSNNNSNNGGGNLVCTTTTTTLTTTTLTTTSVLDSNGRSINIDNLPVGYICNRKGEICVILEHPYPQMVYQIIEEKIREVVLPKLKS